MFLPILRQKSHKSAFLYLVFFQLVGDFVFEIGVQLSDLDDLLQKVLIFGAILFWLLEIWAKYLFFDLQFLQSQMKLLIALQNRRRNADWDILLMRCLIFFVLALSEAAHIGLDFLFLSGCLQQIMLKQVLSIEYAAEFLHERDLLFP